MSYQCELQLSPTPDAVFTALTTSKGTAGWWAGSNRLRKENGGELLFLDSGQVKKLMKLEERSPVSKATWHVLACSLHAWPGTRMTFKMAPGSNGCSLPRLEHEGLTPQLECFQSCSSGSAHFMASLRSYAETGSGTRH